jgi:hypothetical protein
VAVLAVNDHAHLGPVTAPERHPDPAPHPIRVTARRESRGRGRGVAQAPAPMQWAGLGCHAWGAGVGGSCFFVLPLFCGFLHFFLRFFLFIVHAYHVRWKLIRVTKAA